MTDELQRVVHKARHRKSKDLVALKRILLHSEKDGVRSKGRGDEESLATPTDEDKSFQSRR